MKEKKVKIRYLILNVRSVFIFFIKIGILPKIKPIKQNLVCAWKLLKKNFNTLLTAKTPKNPPTAIGNKYIKFFLKFLNNPNIESTNLSYIPNITQSTPLLIPGSIAPLPNNIPTKNLLII